MSSHYSLKDNYRKAFENFLRPALVLKNSSQRRNKSGYIPFGMMAAVVGISFAVLLITSSQSFKAFHNTAHNLDNWDTTALAAATITANESNTFLKLLKHSLESSFANTHKNGQWMDSYEDTCQGSYKKYNPKTKKLETIYFDYDCEKSYIRYDAFVIDGHNQRTQAGSQLSSANAQHRRNLVNTFINQTLPALTSTGSKLRKNIEYGLEVGPSVRHRSYRIKEVIGSDYVAPQSNYRSSYVNSKGEFKNIDTTKIASTLITDLVPRTLVYNPESINNYLTNLTNKFTSGNGIRISDRLLRVLVNAQGDPTRYGYFVQHQHILGLQITGPGDGLDFSTLPTGIKLEIETNIPVIKDKRVAQSEQAGNVEPTYMVLEKSSTAQLRLLAAGTTCDTPGSCSPIICPDGTPVTNLDQCVKDPTCDVNGKTITVTRDNGFCFDSPFIQGCECYCGTTAGKNDCQYCPEVAGACDSNNPGGGTPACKDGGDADGVTVLKAKVLADNYIMAALNPSQAISETNPLYIIRTDRGEDDGKRKGYFTKVWQDSNGVMHYENGKGFFGGNGLLGLTQFPDDSPAVEIGTITGTCNDGVIEIPFFSRIKRRFGKTTTPLVVNGIKIPEGAVISASLDKDAHKPTNLDYTNHNSDYDEIRFYDPVDGTLIAVWHPGDGQLGHNVANDIATFNEGQAGCVGGNGGLAGLKTIGCSSADSLYGDSAENPANAFTNTLLDMIDKTVDRITDPRSDGFLADLLGNDDSLEDDDVFDQVENIDLGDLDFGDQDPATVCLRDEKNEARGSFDDSKDKVTKELNSILGPGLTNQYLKFMRIYKKAPSSRTDEEKAFFQKHKDKYHPTSSIQGGLLKKQYDAYDDAKQAFKEKRDQFDDFRDNKSGSAILGTQCLKEKAKGISDNKEGEL